MNTITTKDGTRIFYKDWGPRNGQPIIFSHGWPLTADAWDAQLVFFASQGFRAIAHDRRSHGRSDQVWDNNNMDQYADDLAELIEQLDLRDIILVGHSTGGGEVTRYIGRHGTARVAKVGLIGAVPPLMLKTEANPIGLPIEAFDDIRKGTFDNRSQYFKDITIPFYGYNRQGAVISEGIRDDFWRQGMMGGLKGQLDSIRAFSESDFSEDLAKFDVPTLVLHGSDDQIVPIDASALSTVKIVKHAVLKIYEGADHGLTQTHQDRFNADLLDFINA
nr:alpha/beta hydrolase [Sphingomonas sp. Y57]